MKRCSRCQLEFESHYTFCIKCGGPLTEINVIQEVCESLTKECPACNISNNNEYLCCRNCGHSFVENDEEQETNPTESVSSEAETPVGETCTHKTTHVETKLNNDPIPLPSEAEEQASKGTTSISDKKKSNILLISVGAVAILAIIIFFTIPKTTNSIVTEIRRGNLVTNDGKSAYDIYLKTKGKLDSKDLVEIIAQAAPAAEDRANQIFAGLKQGGSDSESEWAEAIRLYSWLNDMSPKNAYESRKYFSQARVKFLRKDYNGSITDYQRSIQLDSKWALPFNGLGRAYVNIKDRANARENYLRATQVEPGWIYPYLNLGALCIEMNDYKAAEDFLKRALTIDPNKSTAYYFLGQASEKMEKWCDAINYYRQALIKSNNSTSPGFTGDALKVKIDRMTSKYSCG